MPNLLDNFKDYERIIEEHENGKEIGLEINSSPTCMLALILYFKEGSAPLSNIDAATESRLSAIENNSEELKEDLYNQLDAGFGGEFLLRFIINEIINNIEEHSYSSNSYFLSRDYGDRLELSFIDDGISIPKSLENAGICFENDCDAIDKAINGASEDKTNELLRGYGLNSSLNLVARGNGGEILISSRKGLLHIDKYEKGFKELKKNYIQGTQVSMLINKSIVEDFYQYMEHIEI